MSPRRVRSAPDNTPSLTDVGTAPYLGQGYPDRFDALLNDLQEHRREIAALVDILQAQEPGRKKRLIRHYVVLEVYKFASRARQLSNEINKVQRKIEDAHTRHGVPCPVTRYGGSIKAVEAIERELEAPRNKVIAHRFEHKSGKSVSLNEAGELATRPREEELLPMIPVIEAEIERAADWIGQNRRAIWDNVDRFGRPID